MQQHLVVWGDIGTDHKALIAIKLVVESNQVVYRAFPEEDVTKQLQDQLFIVWKNGGEFEFPEDVPTWTVDAAEDNILPAEIRLHKPHLLVNAQRNWNKKVALDSTFKLLGDKLHVLELELDGLREYDKSLWDRTRSLWDEILDLRKKEELGWQSADELKLRINIIFDALKAFRRLNQEKNYDESLALFKLFGKRADDNLAKLIYPDEWGKIANTMKELQKELKEAPLIMKHRRGIEQKINAVFNDLRKYRKSDQVNHLQDRLSGLNRVLHALRGAIERDSDSYKNQFEKLKHYTRGKLSDDEIREQLGTPKSRTGDKEKKIKSIKKTIKSLEAKIEQLKKPAPPRQKKRSKPNKDNKQKAASNAEAAKPETQKAAKTPEKAPAGPAVKAESPSQNTTVKANDTKIVEEVATPSGQKEAPAAKSDNAKPTIPKEASKEPKAEKPAEEVPPVEKTAKVPEPKVSEKTAKTDDPEQKAAPITEAKDQETKLAEEATAPSRQKEKPEVKSADAESTVQKNAPEDQKKEGPVEEAPPVAKAASVPEVAETIPVEKTEKLPAPESDNVPEETATPAEAIAETVNEPAEEVTSEVKETKEAVGRPDGEDQPESDKEA